MALFSPCVIPIRRGGIIRRGIGFFARTIQAAGIARRRAIAALERTRIRRVFRALEILDFLPGQAIGHKIAPNVLAPRIGHELGSVVARPGPYRARKLRSVADEPQVVVIVGRTRLAGGYLAGRKPRRRRRAIRSVVDDSFEHAGNGIGHRIGKNLLAFNAGSVIEKHVAIAVGDGKDSCCASIDATRCKRSIRTGHFRGIRVVNAKGNCRSGADVAAIEAQALGDLFHRFGRNAARGIGDQAHIARIRRDRGHVRYGHGSVVAVAIVINLRPVDLDRPRIAIHVSGLRIDAFFDGIGERKRLERRASLNAGRARRDIVLVAIVIAAADHRLDEARVRIDEGKGELLVARSKTAGIILFLHGLLGIFLHLGIDGRDNLQAALEHLLMIVGFENLIANIAREIFVQVDAVGSLVLFDLEIEVFRFCRFVFFLSYNAVGKHARKNHVAAVDGIVGIRVGIIHSRRIGNADKRCRLGDCKIARVRRIVMAGGSLNSVAIIAIVDGIEVHQQDLVFGIDFFHFVRERHFANLALDGNIVHLGRENRVADVLLGNSGSALLPA